MDITATHKGLRLASLITLTLLVGGSTGTSARAQTYPTAPAIRTRDYLSPAQRKGLPGLPTAHWDKTKQQVVLTRSNDPHFYVESFFDPPPLSDVTQDRLVLGKDAAGNLIVAQLLMAGKLGGLPNTPTVSITGRTEPLSFGSYLTDPAVFPDHKELNEIRYATTRGVSPEDYRFVGFARAHGTVFVGVVYINRAPSDQRRGRNNYLFLLFRLSQTVDKKGSTQWTASVVPQPDWKNALPSPRLPKDVNDWEDIDPIDGDPLLDVEQEEGDLYLLSGEHLWRRSAAGTWKDTGSIRSLLPSPPLRKSDSYSWVRYSQVYLRGRWLIVISQSPLSDGTGKPPPTKEVVRIFDAPTRHLVRTIEWSLPKG